MSYQDFYKPKPAGRSGYNLTVSSSGRIGTGGITVANTATTSVIIPVGRVKASVLSLALEFLTAAASVAAVTVQVFQVTVGGTKTALTAATSIKSDVITGSGAANYALAITSTLFDGAGNATRIIDGTAGSYLQVDVVAAGTVTTQPQGHVTAELAVVQ